MGNLPEHEKKQIEDIMQKDETKEKDKTKENLSVVQEIFNKCKIDLKLKIKLSDCQHYVDWWHSVYPLQSLLKTDYEVIKKIKDSENAFVVEYQEDEAFGGRNLRLIAKYFTGLREGKKERAKLYRHMLTHNILMSNTQLNNDYRLFAIKYDSQIIRTADEVCLLCCD